MLKLPTKKFTDSLNFLIKNKKDKFYKLVEETKEFKKFEYIKQIPTVIDKSSKYKKLFIYIYAQNYPLQIIPYNEDCFPLYYYFYSQNNNVFATLEKTKKDIVQKVNAISKKDKIDYLYENTIGTHNNKALNIQRTLNSLLYLKKIKDVQSYLHIYIANMIDLLFHFNSFLLNLCIIEKFLLPGVAFQYTGNGNSIKELMSLIIKNKKTKNISLIQNRILIYEKFFRHAYAHGNSLNLINTLLLTNPILILEEKGKDINEYDSSKTKKQNKEIFENNSDRFRIAVCKKELQFLKDSLPPLILVGLTAPPTTEEDLYIKKNKSSHIPYTHFLLTEKYTRFYINLKGAEFLTCSPSKMQYICDRIFTQNKYRKIDKLIILGKTKNTKKKLIPYTNHICYIDVKKDIDDFIKLITI